MRLDAKSLKPIPGSAAKDPDVSSDGLKYTFTLRDMKYSDGQPVTAKDFAYGFTRLCDPAVEGQYSFTGYVIASCEAWHKMDTMKATQAEPDAAKRHLDINVGK